MELNDRSMNETRGQLAIDVYQTEDQVIIKAPIAGVSPADLDISINEESITIKGERKRNFEINNDSYLVQECHWGEFSRIYQLPTPIVPERSTAILAKDGILTVNMPKDVSSKTKILTVQAG